MNEEAKKQLRLHRDKLLFLMFGGAIGIVLLVMGGYQLIEFTDSVAFCGQLCHKVMYPEYTAHQASPHSRVACYACHVGSGASYLVKSKLTGIPLIFKTIDGTYDRPIPTPVENLRPARETCEQCHRPERFAGGLVITHATYAGDEKNTEKLDTRVMRVGGGEAEIAQGIHWHIASKVYYLPLDKERQDIGWVGVESQDGEITEYTDPEKTAEITPQRIATEERLMDCIDCHNRATHIFSSPSELIDASIFQGKIDSGLPFIKREGVNALEPANPSLEQAFSKIARIKEFYRNSYPQIYQENGAAIDKAVAELNKIATLTTFPHMRVTWTTYVDNLGHQDSPGCFRCHGKLVATNGAQKGKKIDASCDSCHYIPS